MTVTFADFRYNDASNAREEQISLEWDKHEGYRITDRNGATLIAHVMPLDTARAFKRMIRRIIKAEIDERNNDAARERTVDEFTYSLRLTNSFFQTYGNLSLL